MATRLEITFPTIKTPRYRVRIDDSSYASSIIQVDAADDGFTMDYSGDSDDVLDPVKGSRVTFTIAVTDSTLSSIQSFATDLISSAEERFTMRLDRDVGSGFTLFWCGYILPDLSGFEDKAPPYGFSVTATDGLARLKSVEYKDTTPNPDVPYGYVSFLTHILNCLNQGALAALYFSTSDVFLRTSVNWGDQVGPPTTTKCPLAYGRVNGEIFAKKITTDSADEWEYNSCYDVLKKIISNWQCRILFSDGAYRVEQITERTFDNFLERRFSRTGTLLSSINNATYDITVPQTANEVRLAGGVFNYMPALKKVTANWEHKAFRNFLGDAGGKWILGSSSSAIVTVQNITTDANTYFRLSGSIYFNVDLGEAYTVPWRYIIGMQVRFGNDYLKSTTYSKQDASGNYIQVIDRNPPVPEWTGTASFYDITTDWIYSTTGQQTVSFNIITSAPPAGTNFIQIYFQPLFGYTVSEALLNNTNLVEWIVLNPEMYIFAENDPDTLFEVDREYVATNGATGNSDELTFDMVFGSNTASWAFSKIQTTSDLATWVDSTNTWHRASELTTGAFGDVWVHQAMALRKKPTQTYSGAFWANHVQAHSRVIMPGNTAWLMLRGQFSARENIWRGDWVSAGINETDISIIPIKKKRVLKIPPKGDPFGFAILPGSITATASGFSTRRAETAMAILTANFVGTLIPAGAVTSIPVSIPVGGGTYIVGDDIFVVNPTNGDFVSFNVSVTSLESDTAIAVTSKTIDRALPVGCPIVYSTMNKHLSGGSGLPAATLGRILRGNGSKWVAYGGTTDGLPLVWDTTNGWQEELLNTAGLAPGGVTNAIAADMPANTLKGNPTAAGVDPQDLAVGSITTDATPVSGDFLVGFKAAGTLRKFDVSTLPSSYTDEQAQDAVGAILVDSGTIDFTYADATPSITAIVIDDSITYAKMQNISATQRLLGRNTAGAGNTEEVTTTQAIDWIGATQGQILYRSATAWTALSAGTSGQFLQTQGAAANPHGATLSARPAPSGTSGRSAIYDSATNITTDTSPFFWDFTNDRLGINTASPTATCHVGVPTSTTLTGLNVLGNLSANLNNIISNVNNTSAANAIMTLQVGGTSAGDPILQFLVPSGTSWSAGVDNSDSDSFRIRNSAGPSSAGGGITLTVGASANVGINNTAPAVALDVISNTSAIGLPVGTTAQRPAVNQSIRSNSTVGGLEYRFNASWYRLTSNLTPTSTIGAAAGTGATKSNGGNDRTGTITVTTGTGTTTGTLITITFNQGHDASLGLYVQLTAVSSTAAAEITKVYIGSSGNSSFVLTAGSALTASTVFTWHYHVKQ